MSNGVVEVSPRSTAVLVLAARSAEDDVAAVTDLVNHCLPQISDYVGRRGAAQPEALANLILAEFVRALPRLTFTSSQQFWSYLYHLSRSRLSDERRKALRDLSAHQLDETNPNCRRESGFEDRIVDQAWLTELLSSLTAEQREVVKLRFQDDLTLEETARRTGRSLSAVKGLQRRALAALAATASFAAAVIVGLLIIRALGNDIQSVRSVEPADFSTPFDPDRSASRRSGSFVDEPTPPPTRQSFTTNESVPVPLAADDRAPVQATGDATSQTSAVNTTQLVTTPTDAESSTTQTGLVPAPLGTSTTQPGTSTTQPGMSIIQFGTSATQPGTSTTQPGTSTIQFGTSTTQPGTSTTTVVRPSASPADGNDGLRGLDSSESADLETFYASYTNQEPVAADLEGFLLAALVAPGRDFRGANLQDSNLRRANLKGATLDGANLDVADLAGANLEGASLDSADLWNANLISINLLNASLRGAFLNGAQLSGANLNNADLTEATLGHTKMGTADLRGANLTGADLTNADLRAVSNLALADLSGVTWDVAYPPLWPAGYIPPVNAGY